MKYALIGCGRIAGNHVKVVVNNRLEFIAACDIVPTNIDVLFDKTNYAERDKVSRYSDYKKWLLHNRTPYVNAVAGRNALEMVFAIYKSMKTVLPVQLPLKDFASTDLTSIFVKK